MKKLSGFMLASALIMLFIISAIGSAMMVLTAYDFFSARDYLSDNVLVNIADAGVENALFRLNSGNYANFTSNITPTIPSGVSTWGSYTVNITPISGSRYKIESTGTLNGKSKKITAIATTTPYSQYLQWNDQENTSANNITGVDRGTWIPAGKTYLPEESMDGPIYINQDLWTAWGPRNYTNPKNPIFKGPVTISGSLNWHVYGGWGGPQTPSPSGENELLYVFKNTPTVGAASKTWPFSGNFTSAFATQRTIANGNSTSYPSYSQGQFPDINELKFSSNGGLYIVNDWEGVWFGWDAQQRQLMRLGRGYQGGAQRDRYIDIIWDTANNRTLAHYLNEAGQVTSSDYVYSGTPKVIWMDGSAYNFGGQVCEKISLFVGGFIRLTEDVSVIDTDNDGDLTDEKGIFGIVTPYMWVPNGSGSDGWRPPTKLQAAVIATGSGGSLPQIPSIWMSGSFCAENSLSSWQRTLNVYGAIMQKDRGSLGIYNGGDMSPNVGYTRNYKYDSRLVENSSPYFPNDGKFFLRYWTIN